jgi:hypothetical protein
LEFIRSAKSAAPSLPFIAVATVHSDDVERATRAAGATWYVAGSASRVFEKVLAAVVSQEN